VYSAFTARWNASEAGAPPPSAISRSRSGTSTSSGSLVGFVVVVIACAIVGLYLWGLDQMFRPLVDKVLL
jgi:hypothetical protein